MSPSLRSPLRNAFEIEVPLEVIAPPRNPDGSVLVALHGMGQSAESFAREVEALLPPGTTGIVPQAPYPYEMRGKSGIRQGNAWYVYTGENESFLASMRTTETWLLGVIADEVARLSLHPARVALLGFSQGGYLAGFVGVRNAARFRAVIVAGGRIKDEALVDAAPGAASLPLLHVHGADDTSVLPEPARVSVERMVALGVPAEFRSYPAAHPVLREATCQRDVCAYIAAHTAAAN